MADGDCLKVNGKEFCYSRKQPCPCSKAQDYASHNQATTDSWGKYFQMQLKQRKASDPPEVTRRWESLARSAEHHHIVCVSAICNFLPAANNKVRQYAEATTWCINDAENLIALPMWAMSLLHYCDMFARRPEVKTEKVPGAPAWSNLASPVERPPFFNLPMHDQDHDRFLSEVNDDLAAIAQDLTVVSACQDPETTLKEELARVIEKYSMQLTENGASARGTHENWNLGMNIPDSTWYKPFSMSRNPRERIHPIAEGKYRENMQALHTAFWLDGHPVLFV